MKKIGVNLIFIFLTVTILSFVVCIVHTNDALAINGDGLTPGFWKQPQHFDRWVQYSPDDSFEDVFVVQSKSTSGMTLLDALKKGGGGINALNRHAVAALLNHTNSYVSYLFSEASVISLVQQAYNSGDYEIIKMTLAYQNEMGSTLD